MNWRAKYPHILHQPLAWQDLLQGEVYCKALKQYFKKWFRKISGDTILLSGELSCEFSNIIDEEQTQLQQILLYTHHPATEPLSINRTFIRSSLTYLPLISDSLNACLLTNTLNFCQDPHQVLREITRVLTTDGYLLMSLFNPYSTLGLKQHLHRPNNKVRLPFRQYFIWRVIDWLDLLGYQILDQQCLVYPHWLCGSHLRVIVAQKKSKAPMLNTTTTHFNPILKPINALTRCLKAKCG